MKSLLRRLQKLEKEHAAAVARFDFEILFVDPKTMAVTSTLLFLDGKQIWNEVRQ